MPRGEDHQPLPQGTETVLLVDDEDSVRSVLAGALSQEGYRVLEAGNGKEALGLIQRCGESIDLLLTDVTMPEMDGEDLADRAKASRPNLKVLFMSGYPNPHLGQALLQKPFTLPVLIRRVRHILDT